MLHFDVTCAYLIGEIEEIIQIEPPKELNKILKTIVEDEGKSDLGRKSKMVLEEMESCDKVCLLKKFLYGLKQA